MKVVTGACREGCAACCKVIAMPGHAGEALIRFDGGRRYVALPLRNAGNADYRDFLAKRGVLTRGGEALVPIATGDARPVQTGRYAGHPALYVKSACPQLDGTRCRLHGTDQKPRVCREWPRPGDDLSSVKDECGYRIEEGGPDG